MNHKNSGMGVKEYGFFFVGGCFLFLLLGGFDGLVDFVKASTGLAFLFLLFCLTILTVSFTLNLFIDIIFIIIDFTLNRVFGSVLDEFEFLILKAKFYKSKPYSIIILKITEICFSPKTRKHTFEPIVADWQEEYFEALHKKEIWKARWVNVSYTYAFIMAMWQKSPLGDLLKYVRKIAS